MFQATALHADIERLAVTDKTRPLSFDWLIAQLKACLGTLPETRNGSNTQYRVYDAAASAFSMFFMQQPSFLAYQRQLEERQGQNNAQSLFGVTDIPSDNQTRTILDPLSPGVLSPVFNIVLEAFKASGEMETMRAINQTLLAPLDGVQYFSSNELHCEHCSTRVHKDGHVSYSHQAILPCFVAPDSDTVISLPPVFITPQDGHHKQDSEIAAAKRWLSQHGASLTPLGVTFLGDDLYAHQPFCETVLASQGHFIFTAKEDSHKTLYQNIHEISALGKASSLTLHRRHGKKKVQDIYTFINHLPLRDGKDALLVNWCELVIQQEGKILARHAFITDHHITVDNVDDVVLAGRARWKTENENHNTLKNHGYHLSHNFGHGKQFLAQTLLTLNILAFLTHTILQRVDRAYIAVRQKLGTRQKFFQSIQVLTQFFYFNHWQHLIHFMAQQLELSHLLLQDTS
jgi:hypothetical protein